MVRCLPVGARGEFLKQIGNCDPVLGTGRGETIPARDSSEVRAADMEMKVRYDTSNRRNCGWWMNIAKEVLA
ncbi:hypothetical protein PAXRUDRAFT_828979 [Paxillus rubicundulus Ve08.2h10]|uniref:Uncharacterized protein n=1 Tax=Paxillus rubicundulus Ve08.2h10 TaxID=930991 RepID=A0A0D0E6S4_9AGAM|nr:hypothetical protein PAXRUDRAFT_828979 [Paxillus rubicundulus Ve08.2h10]